MQSTQTYQPHRKEPLDGFILAIVVVYGAVFLTIALGMTGYLLGMQRSEQAHIQNEGAFNIAEAGVNYYAWHLAHFPSDLQDGTGHAGPYVHEYRDPEDDVAGAYTLNVVGNRQCNQLTSIDITSEGSTVQNTDRKATIVARYAQPSVAEYSYIVNANTWVGENRNILGRFHSNYGIHMDGNNLSTIESSVSTWSCTSSYGCSPTATKPGVFGSGTNPAWWQYPVPQMDFGSITGNLSTIKTAAQSGGGRYFAKLNGDQTQRGYHAIFRDNGTVDVYQVTATKAVWGYTSTDGWERDYNIISSQSYLGNYPIPAACSVLFFDSRVWLEGVIKGKVTVGASGDIVTPNNITYATTGKNGLTAITQSSIEIPLDCPNDLTLMGVFVAQNGRFGRKEFIYSWSDYYSVPSAYSSYVVRDSVTTVGSIISNGMPVTMWSSGGNIVSGFRENNPTYDGNLAKDPPPFTPFTSALYRFVSWRQY